MAPSGDSLLFVDLAVSEAALVIEGGLLGDVGHVGRGRTVGVATDDASVGVGGAGERFPHAAGEGVAALAAVPDASSLAADLAVLARGAGVLGRLLGQGDACVAANAHTVAGAEASGTSGFLSALGQSVPLHAADEFSEFTTVRSGDLKDLGEFGGREGSF